MRRAHNRTLPAATAVPWQTQPRVKEGARARVVAAATAVAALCRTWRERERLRRELAAMSPRDFGDVAVPLAAVRDELRRWPWQKTALATGREDRRSPGPPDAAGIDVMRCILSPFVTALRGCHPQPPKRQ